MGRRLFVSDVHLTIRDHEKLDRLEALFARRLRPGDTLYLVGDIFEYWVSAVFAREPVYARLIRRFAALVAGGTAVEFVTGNRDFNVGRAFERETGVLIRGHSARIDLDGLRVFLEHGDLRFNRNWKHSLFRNVTKMDLVRRSLRATPGWLGHWVGRRVRRVSVANTSSVEWPPDELVRRSGPVFGRGNDVFIFGHIHLPQRVGFRQDGRVCELYVLGDWDATGEYLEYEEGRFTLKPGF